MNRKLDIWRNRCFEKMDDLSVLTKPNPLKMDVFPKHFLQIILAAKWLMQHSSTSPKQQRRPLPSLLYKSFFYEKSPSIVTLLQCYLKFCRLDLIPRFNCISLIYIISNTKLVIFAIFCPFGKCIAFK